MEEKKRKKDDDVAAKIHNHYYVVVLLLIVMDVCLLCIYGFTYEFWFAKSLTSFSPPQKYFLSCKLWLVAAKFTVIFPTCVITCVCMYVCILFFVQFTNTSTALAWRQVSWCCLLSRIYPYYVRVTFVYAIFPIVHLTKTIIN